MTKLLEIKENQMVIQMQKATTEAVVREMVAEAEMVLDKDWGREVAMEMATEADLVTVMETTNWATEKHSINHNQIIFATKKEL